ncbi:MAG: 4Fe-4S dicluster domain-containing protein [Adlercreutzia sp.]|nr:4Fe-4S dicluster domain-containing protein [Adlercreutzia sp.]
MGTADKLAPLGFGFMRLPLKDENDPASIDIEKTCELVDVFMDAGFTYFDSARGYHAGKSEWALKKALVERYPREAFTIATKLPAWLAENAEHARAMFDKSLRECGVDYFDYYLLHNLGESLTQCFEDFGLWEFCAQMKAEGKIRKFGFSIHDNAEELERVLDAHPEVDFVQLQINYVDWESDIIQSRRCYEVCQARGLPVVIMEPVKGGTLVKLPDAVADVLREAEPGAPLASWALRFAGSLPNVIAVLSGMNTPEMVAENAAIMRDCPPLTDEERQVIDRAREVLTGLPGVPCTDCRYCMKGCPEGVHINTIMQSLNIYDQMGDAHRAQENYNWNAGDGKASTCIQCGACEAVCPQHIEIVSQLERAADLFE